MPDLIVDTRDLCDGVLSGATETVQKLFGRSQTIAKSEERHTSLDQITSLLTTDTAQNAAAAEARTLCAIHPRDISAWFSLTFQWEPFSGVPPTRTSSDESTQFTGIGYTAYSQDEQALIDFSCQFPSVGQNDSHGLYMKALAETEGLDALPRAEKREAQLRVLHAAAVKVAAAMKCVTNLPSKLGTLTPLPPAR